MIMNVTNPDLQPIVDRLAAVECENRFLKRLVAAACFASLVLVGFALFASRGGVVEAKEFVVRDDQGNRRAVWTTTSQGVSVLHLLDGGGAARATLSVTPEGAPTLALTDHDEKSLAAMAVTNEGPALGLYDADRQPLIAMP
jgi:apolipoprotein N-acyltransferase